MAGRVCWERARVRWERADRGAGVLGEKGPWQSGCAGRGRTVGRVRWGRADRGAGVLGEEDALDVGGERLGELPPAHVGDARQREPL